jgi:hypothetical protein
VLTEEVAQFQKDHEGDVRAQVPAPVIKEVLDFLGANGRLTHDYYRYDERSGEWKLADGPSLAVDTEMGEDVVLDGESATAQELSFEGRPDFVRDICEGCDATSLMKDVLRNPKDAEAADRFLSAVNAEVIEKSIEEGLDDKAYLLNMGFIRQAVMVCAGNGVLIEGMKEKGFTKLDGTGISMYESQRDEHRKGFVNEIGSKGYPLDWEAMFDKTIIEITSQHKDKTQVLYSAKDVADAAGGHKPEVTFSVYDSVKEAFETEEVERHSGINPSQESLATATPEPASSISEVNTAVTSVEYLGKHRPIGAVRIANWNQYANARANGTTCTPRHQVLVRTNETQKDGKSILPYWDIVKANLLDFDVEAYGEENIDVTPGQDKDLTTRKLADFHIMGIAVAPTANDAGRMPDMLVLGRCEEDGKAHLFTKTTLTRHFSEGPTAKKILGVMKENNMCLVVPEGVSERTRSIWTGKKTKTRGKPSASKTVEVPGRGNSDRVLSDTNDDDGYILSNKSRKKSHEGGREDSVQTKDNRELRAEVTSLSEDMKSLKAMVQEFLKQSSKDKEN